MPNYKGWYTKEEVLETGLPYYIPSSKRWTDTPYAFAVLLTKSRCSDLGVPIMTSGEKPSAFKYIALAGSGTNDDKRYRYAPLYDRTEVHDLIKDRLYGHEIMGCFNQ